MQSAGSPLGLTNMYDRNPQNPFEFSDVRRTDSRIGGGSYYKDPNFQFNETDKYKLKNSINSIFNKNKFYFRPTSSATSDSKNWSNENKNFHNSNPNNDDIYDISTNSIIDYTQQYPSMKLKPQDFAYLKNLGVYPNNRLIVARRFSHSVGDDLTSELNNEPISTLISWYDKKYPVDINFDEEWEQGEGNLLDIFDQMFATGESLSGGAGAAGAVFSKISKMPGFSEGLQYEILKQLGVVSEDFGVQNIPSGDPNLIQKSMRRKIGNSLNCDITVDFETEYEQKFIADTDPTIVYLDIINNVLRFGSSESKFLIDSKGGSNKLTEFLTRFKHGDLLGSVSMLIIDIIKAVGNLIVKLAEGIGKGISALATGDTDSLTETLADSINFLFAPVISKFRVTLTGIISSMTGEASTPWHITVGNPKAPIFCSGDMLCKQVSIKLGETLAFNDLPSTVKISFKMKNARPLGIQEIFKKYNCGKGRSYINLDQSEFEMPVQKFSSEDLRKVGNNLVEALGGVTADLADTADSQSSDETGGANINSEDPSN